VLGAEQANTTEYRERLAAEKKYPEALQAYKEALEKDPKNPALLYNAGMMAYFCAKPKEAAELWSQVKALDPNDWRVRAKLVQAHEAAGDTKKRDAEREELFKLRKNTADKELKSVKHYCRDQFSVGKERVMVFEYFELEGDEPVRLSFLVSESDEQDVQSRYTLGSYRLTNEFAKELKQIKPDQRLFHLDGYFNGGRSHRTYAFFVDEPKYDAIKAAVKEILAGKRKPVSGTDS
jgi:tetratricopeptide (TPR) repeat protein